MQILSVAPIRERLWQQISEKRQALQNTPRLAILRCVEGAETAAAEEKIRRACRKAEAEVWTAALPNYMDERLLVKAAHQVGVDPSVQGICVFCPEAYDKGRIGAAIGTGKDVGGFGLSDGGIYPPCALEAVMRVIAAYGLSGKGKTAAILYRDKPFAESLGAALVQTGAEVKVCRWKQPGSEKFCQDAELLISAVGIPGAVGREYLSNGQTVLDAGCGMNQEGKICGDFARGAAERAETAVLSPEGLDALFPELLVLHLLEAAERQEKERNY